MKLSDYVIPSERKRDEVRYQIRMKMLRASAISYERPLTSDNGRVKKKHDPEKVKRIKRVQSAKPRQKASKAKKISSLEY